LDSVPFRMHQIVSINLREQVEKEIRSAIIQGKFFPGERLVESVIATEMGVSRAPLREVLSALEREGLVVNIPRRGCFVIDFIEKDIDDIYNFRLLLEVGALRHTIQRITPQGIAEMQRQVDDLSTALVLHENIELITALDLAFHESLCIYADNNRLYTTWKSIRAQTQFLLGVISKSNDLATHGPVLWHQTILDAIKEKNSKIAEKELTEHILDGCERARLAMREMRAVESTKEDIP
jgi:DNA-binding GntR family transcriptional regulator